MENIYFKNSSDALRYIRKNSIEIYDGVYKKNDGTLIKKYDKQKSLDRFDDFCEDNLLLFKDVYIDGVSFTRALLYSSLKKIYATITEYIPGISIDIKSLGNYSIDELLVAIRKLENTIKQISDLGICATDIYRGNIVYDGNTFSLIDTIEYHYGNSDKDEIYVDNMLAIMNEVFTSVFYKDGLDSVTNIHKYFSLRSSELEYFNSVDNLMNPNYTLIKIRKFIEEDFGIKINTFNECYSYIYEVVMNYGKESKKLLIKRNN